MSEHVQSLERGLAVIRSFHAEAPSRTLSEVARATGLNRATARRFLLTLAGLGYVRSDGRDFALTPRVLELGYAYLSGLGLPEIAQPHLEALSHEVGESASASVLDGADIVYVARVPVRRIMSVRLTVGTRLPAAATSMGRVLLAALPDAERDAVIARLPETPAAARRLVAAVREAREQGWALVDQELEPGLCSIAVPLHAEGRVVAAINVAVAASSDAAERLRSVVLPALRTAAARIEDDIAHVGG
ncbi:MAG: IclR family transcriptional regulator C-terminal domain-containing protein [Microbacteriaceae bacterium]